MIFSEFSRLLLELFWIQKGLKSSNLFVTNKNEMSWTFSFLINARRPFFCKYHQGLISRGYQLIILLFSRANYFLLLPLLASLILSATKFFHFFLFSRFFFVMKNEIEIVQWDEWKIIKGCTCNFCRRLLPNMHIACKHICFTAVNRNTFCIYIHAQFDSLIIIKYHHKFKRLLEKFFLRLIYFIIGRK